MNWDVEFCDEFDAEFESLASSVQDVLLQKLLIVRKLGPSLGRPLADTLNGSEHANMKELRFNADGGVWRVAMAFDPARCCIVLCAGDKSGTNEARFYRSLIATVDARFDRHLKKNE